ncbi:hypothetical protein PB01_02780 [Psychrobacillus glaciei]|uniref:DUF3953 domain-containing protein n=1 Tax=Psychrobacillus glaciei TaxID=2283160 RepID=A0A5J6SM32_9BACI|nr:hypothetical protein [Psychrobacillus glaciei]QFF97824.1 hypothetical protein PB01_02780 [Psychrobacillus glaciei]
MLKVMRIILGIILVVLLTYNLLTGNYGTAVSTFFMSFFIAVISIETLKNNLKSGYGYFMAFLALIIFVTALYKF